MSENIYIKLNRNTRIDKEIINLSDIASIYCRDNKLLAIAKNLKLGKLKDYNERLVISDIKIIELMESACQSYKSDITVSSLGEKDAIVQRYKAAPKSGFIKYIKIAVIAFIIFTGSMYSIMAYNNDVGVNELFDKVYVLFGMDKKDNSLEISYSLGLLVGIAVFYNHFKLNKYSTPTPIEIQMRSYETDIDTAIIQQASRTLDEEV